MRQQISECGFEFKLRASRAGFGDEFRMWVDLLARDFESEPVARLHNSVEF